MASQIKPVSPTTGQIEYFFNYVKLDGSPGKIQVPPVVTLSDPAMAVLVVAADGMSAKVQHNGSFGLTSLMVGEVDGDLGTGVRTIPAMQEDITMLSDEGAVGVGLISSGTETGII